MHNIKFIGDLSINDSKILEQYAKNRNCLLEFGMGGSTQIIAQVISDKAKFISLETNSSWLVKTREMLHKLNCAHKAELKIYKSFDFSNLECDFIFNDGIDQLREPFGFASWNLLKPGGVYLSHDTRHINNITHITNLIKDKFTEIKSIECNKDDSNITIITKQENNPYVNWHMVEKFPDWKYDALRQKVPENFWNE